MRDHQIAKPAEALRIDLMQGPHRTGRAPPILADRLEPGDLVRVDAGRGVGGDHEF
jgi:hypothetical protein